MAVGPVGIQRIDIIVKLVIVESAWMILEMFKAIVVNKNKKTELRCSNANPNCCETAVFLGSTLLT